MTEQLYHVRQYRPAYFSGFESDVSRDISREQILKAPWLKNFEHDNFSHFTIKHYWKDEEIIEAHYKDGKSWVAGFVIPADSGNDGWRYQKHES